MCKPPLIEFLRHLRGFVFRWQRLSPDWNHDHCQGCWASFGEGPVEEKWRDRVHTEGWVTLWPVRHSASPAPDSRPPVRGWWAIPAPAFAGFQLDWVCPKCFETCRQELGFVVDPDHPQWSVLPVIPLTSARAGTHADSRGAQEGSIRNRHGKPYAELRPTSLYKLGYSIQSIKEWRGREYDAGRPSGLEDFYRAHGLCFVCHATGVIGPVDREGDVWFGDTCEACGGTGRTKAAI